MLREYGDSSPADRGQRPDPLLGIALAPCGVVDDRARWLWQGDDEKVLKTLRLRTRTGRPAGDAALVARLEELSGRGPAHGAQQGFGQVGECT